MESVRRRKLTTAGAIGGGLTGLCVFIGGGWTGIGLLAVFFVLGTAATAWKRTQKAAIGMAQERGGQRTLGQVVANGGVAGLLGLAALFFPEKSSLLTLLMAGALSSAMADTLSSELGSIYGKRFFNIVSFKKESSGLDGVVSLEGTLMGLAGSAIIAAVYSVFVNWSPAVLWIIVAGTVGNLADSVLGAALERKGLMGNNTVNFINTALGAATLWLLIYFRQHC